MMRVVAGCDGGGTKCTVRVVALSNDGAMTREGQASAGSANVKSDPATAMVSIQTATRDALAAAGLAEDHLIDSYVAALAGAGTAEKQREWESKLSQEMPIRNAAVIADVLALFASIELPQDATVIAAVVGTGSIAWGKFPDGTMVRAGGLGPDIGDEGGGYWIGREALRRCMLGVESERGALRERIVSRFGEAVQGLCNRDTASLAQDVFELASVDTVATNIVESAAGHIAQLLIDVTGTATSTSSRSLPWICAGGVAVHQPKWLRSIRYRCERSNVFLSEPRLVREPVVGALRLAMAE